MLGKHVGSQGPREFESRSLRQFFGESLMDHQLSDINTSKRPFGIWAISIFYIFSCAWTIYSLLWSQLNTTLFPEPQRLYIHNLTFFDYLISLGVQILSLTATFFLFRLKNLSVKLFGSALLLSFISIIWTVFKTHFLSAFGVPTFVGMLIGFSIELCVFMYCKHLSKQGILK